MRNLVIGGLICMLSVSASVVNAANEQPLPIPLWPQEAPGALGQADKDIPQLIPCLPERPNGAAIIICPGGGYARLAMDHEGHQIAQWFSSQGIAAFILKYRLPTDGYRHPIPLLDAQRAIRMVRAGAEKWKLMADRIGILGFSAGGHLASSAGTHFESPVQLENQKRDAIDSLSCRPDFMVLIYPVISMQQGTTHAGSRNNLLGENPPQQLIDLMSNEKQVTPQTPSTFLVHAFDDKGVITQNSIFFYEALRQADVPTEMHIFLKGGHGFGMRPQTGPAAQWPRLCVEWMGQMEFIPK
ncbi:MAG: alpha/beta hydrolase [Planctomycetaceae bacterium]|nr:alpha/beta hydrolase [Planctomycetaceae bacterium]